MAFASRIGNALRRTLAPTCSPLLQPVRCMSSSKLFVGGMLRSILFLRRGVWVSNSALNEPACRTFFCHRRNHSEGCIFWVWECTWRLFVRFISTCIFFLGLFFYRCLTLLYYLFAFSSDHHWSGIREVKGFWFYNFYIHWRSLSCNDFHGWQGRSFMSIVLFYTIAELSHFQRQFF